MTGSKPPETVGEATLRAALTAHGQGLTLDVITRVATLVEFARQDGRIQRTAQALGIGRTTLYRRLERYGVDLSQRLDERRERSR